MGVFELMKMLLAMPKIKKHIRKLQEKGYPARRE